MNQEQKGDFTHLVSFSIAVQPSVADVFIKNKTNKNITQTA